MNETILVCTYLEPEHVERIRAAWDGEVLYEPALLPRPRYQGDHGGDKPTLDEAAERQWRQLLARAEIAFDFDWWQPGELLVNAPNLRWIQATSAGIGGYVQRLGLDSSELVLTTAAGTHAVPLAEFALTGALHLVRGVPDLLQRQQERRWERYTAEGLAGKRVTVVGMGSIGRKVAATFAALGTTVTGVGRPGGSRPDGESLDRFVDTDALATVLPETDVLVLSTPLTPATEGLITRELLGSLPDGAVVVNIARGPVLDNAALVDLLEHGLPNGGRLRGAALDVTDPEPLPTDSPLWGRPDVLISPHSASTVAAENTLIVDIFLDNLDRWRAGQQLRNLYHRDHGY